MKFERTRLCRIGVITKLLPRFPEGLKTNKVNLGSTPSRGVFLGDIYSKNQFK